MGGSTAMRMWKCGATALVFSALALPGCKSDKRSAAEGTTDAAGVSPAASPADPDAAAKLGMATLADYDAPAISRIELPSGLIIEELKPGQGMPALPKALVTFHYRLKAKDGAELTSSTGKEGGPAPEKASIDRLFPGLRDGLVGMSAGGRRRLTVPPSLAPGLVGSRDETGAYRIEPDATLIYVVDMLEVRQQLLTTDPANPTSPPQPGAASEPPKP